MQESIDAHQSLASLRLSQNRPDEASRIIGTVHARVQASRDALQARTIAQEISGATDAPGIEGATVYAYPNPLLKAVTP